MQAPDDDANRAGSMAGGSGSPTGPGSPMGPGERASTGAESAAAEVAPQVEGASLDSGQAGEASASDRRLGSQVLELYLFQGASLPPPVEVRGEGMGRIGFRGWWERGGLLG